MDQQAAILASLTSLHRKLDVLLARGGDAGERFCEAVLASWGDAPFRCADLLEWSDEAPELRREVREAAQALCGTPCRPTPRQLGTALKRLSTVPLMWHRVTTARDDRGTFEWIVTEVRD